MNILLTGGTGFIGSYVAVELLRGGHTVTNLARNPDKIPALRRMQGLTMVAGEMTDRTLLTELTHGKEAVVHIALNYVRRSGPEVLLDDTLPTVHLAAAAAEAGVKQFLYTSSTAVNDSLYMGGPDPWEPPSRVVDARIKQHPATFYGATKAANENFLTAVSHLSPMRVNIIRPGYTFGNPAVEGAPTEGDTRFRDIVFSAARGGPIDVIRNDGTQLIYAGDLARLYSAVLASDFTRRTYFGLSRTYVTWQSVAEEAVRQIGSKSEIRVEDRGWEADSVHWDVSGMEKDFGLAFDPWEKIVEHLDYWRAKVESAD